MAAFERALALEPANWSLCLDLADVRAEQGDFAAAAQLIDQGMRSSRPSSHFARPGLPTVHD